MNFHKTAFLAIALAAISSLSAKAQDSWSDILGTNNASSQQTVKSTLWNGGYEKSFWQVSVGYVNKSWICSYDSVTQREDFFGDPNDKYLHGFQMGGLFTPSFDWGLGLRTGVFLEFYTSRSKWITYWCNHFSEADLYIPVHASFRIPFDEEFSLDLFGGIGFQWAMVGQYYRTTGYVVDPIWRRPFGPWSPWGPVYRPVGQVIKQEYGNGWPQRVNWQAECGLSLRFKMVALNFTYSFGLVDQGIENSFDGGQTFVPANRSRQDKMQATISFVF